MTDTANKRLLRTAQHIAESNGRMIAAGAMGNDGARMTQEGQDMKAWTSRAKVRQEKRAADQETPSMTDEESSVDPN